MCTTCVCSFRIMGVIFIPQHNLQLLGPDTEISALLVKSDAQPDQHESITAFCVAESFQYPKCIQPCPFPDAFCFTCSLAWAQKQLFSTEWLRSLELRGTCSSLSVIPEADLKVSLTTSHHIHQQLGYSPQPVRGRASGQGKLWVLHTNSFNVKFNLRQQMAQVVVKQAKAHRLKQKRI